MKQDQFLCFAEAFPDAMLMASGDGVIVAANTAARDLIRPDRADFTGARIDELVTESNDSVRAFLTRCQRSRQMLIGSLTWSCSTGENIPTRAEGARLTLEASRAEPFLIIRCVPKHTASAGFMALNEQFHALGRELQFRKKVEAELHDQARRLARSNSDLQQFADVASHDLQQPLRTIASFSELLRNRYSGKLDEKAHQYIENIVSAATRMSAMIRDILKYSSELDPASVPHTNVDMNSMVIGVLNDLHSAIQETCAEVTIVDLPTIRAERAGLAQVFLNLINNAIKYRGNEAPRIHVTATDEGSEWIFSVSDNGPGIPPAYHKTVFAMFKRLQRDQHPGTGIGLALCKKVVERHGGRIWIESSGASGSVFKFSIPTSRPSATVSGAG